MFKHEPVQKHIYKDDFQKNIGMRVSGYHQVFTVVCLFVLFFPLSNPEI